jgi:hypothetical protein
MSGKASIPAPPRGKGPAPTPAPAPARTSPADTPAPMKNGAPTEEAVRSRAYALWEAAGFPEGDGVEFWLRAEQELNNTH